LPFRRVIFLDADTLVLQNVDELFTLYSADMLLAVPDCAPPCDNHEEVATFNSGVMVLTPSLTEFNNMTKFVHVLPSATGGDQGFLNSYFNTFQKIHFHFNYLRVNLEYDPVQDQEDTATTTGDTNQPGNAIKSIDSVAIHLERLKSNKDGESVLDAYLRENMHEVKILHFTGSKPWECGRTRDCCVNKVMCETPESARRYLSPRMHRIWWEIADEMIQSDLMTISE